jgi:hypothetical protein
MWCDATGTRGGMWIEANLAEDVLVTATLAVFKGWALHAAAASPRKEDAIF